MQFANALPEGEQDEDEKPLHKCPFCIGIFSVIPCKKQQYQRRTSKMARKQTKLLALVLALCMVYIITSGFNIYGTPEEYGVIGMGNIGPFPVSGIIWLLLVAVVFFILKFTKFGQYVYAIGGNMTATWLSGVNTKLVKTAVYAICGLISGFAGVVLTCRTLLAAANAGLNYEFTAISACVIGGMSLDGGRGNIWGTVVGVLILGLILNIMQLTSVSSYWQDFARGFIIVAAVGVDCLAKVKRD